MPPRPSPTRTHGDRAIPVPANAQEEAAQLAFALRESRIDAMLASLPSQLTNSARMQAEFDFDALPHELKAPYLAMGEAGKLKFLEEVMTTHSHTGPLQAAIAAHGMEVVPNDGRTPNGVNNCFMLSVFEHVDGLDRAQHGMLADHFRDILVSTPGSGARHGEPLSAGGAAARQFVNLINSDPSIKTKLNVEVLSMVGGHLIRDRIDSGSPTAKTVLVIDHGGHFEAVRDVANHATPEDAPPPYSESDSHPMGPTPSMPHQAQPPSHDAPEVSTMAGIQRTHIGQLHLEVAHAHHKARTVLGEALRSLTNIT
ncbi:hypothetical protein [Pandoraea sp. ISTKB]|uniref:hypothetical protein n=1 Tax=Pandoraea sp. ISTKB TaxID=1586708 RepID=UPI001112E72A|nr:hypothetical protein [Pandoraea sp. ISTKB]